MSRVIFAAAALLVAATSAHAQILRSPGARPSLVITPSIGFVDQQSIADGSSGTIWDFTNGLQYRLSLEKLISQEVAIGGMVAYASMPLGYVPMTGTEPMPPTCTPGNGGRCSASVDQTTFAATVSAGGGYGVHQIVNLAIGMTMYDNFRESSTGRQLAPLYADRDFFLTIGLGLGIGISRRFAINIVQDYGIVVHQRSGLEGDITSNSRIYQTRVGTRISFGG